MMKRTVYAVGSFLAGALLCVALVLHMDASAQEWARLLGGLSWPWAVAVAGLTILMWWSGSRKWALWSLALHGEAGAEPSAGFFFRHFAWQNWFGQFVPPPLAIIFGRSWATRYMRGISMREGAGSGLADQGMEFALLAGLLPAAFLVFYNHVSWAAWLSVSFTGMAAVAGGIWFFRSRFPGALQASLLPLLAWSAVRVCLTVARLAAGAPALGLSLDPVSVAAAAPVVALLALLPLTPGNLGLAEWGWAGVLVYGGADIVDAGLYALGFRVLLLVMQSVLILAFGVPYPAFNKKQKETEGL